MHILIDRYISDTYEGERHIDRYDTHTHIYIYIYTGCDR